MTTTDDYVSYEPNEDGGVNVYVDDRHAGSYDRGQYQAGRYVDDAPGFTLSYGPEWAQRHWEPDEGSMRSWIEAHADEVNETED
jgi:hypothetical protein